MVRSAAFGPMDGADGAEGFETLDALGGGRRAVFRPIGVAAEFARRPGEADYRGHRWPPQLGFAWPPAPAGVWPVAPLPIAPRLGDFTPDNASLVVLAELVRLREPGGQDSFTTLMNSTPGDPANDLTLDTAAPWDLQAELRELRLLAQYRAGAMQEALAQRNGIIGYFRALLQFNLQTHPYTYYLAASALRVGQFLCMYYKDRFNRPRPIRLDPSILSPIDPPGHPSYPSGHALQAFLIACCLEQVVPVALGTAFPVGRSPFRLLAQRIAKLREVLGVHYRSDTRAGERVAGLAFPLMMKCARIAGTASAQLAADGLPENQLRDAPGVPALIGGQPVFENGWLALARREWQPR